MRSSACRRRRVAAPPINPPIMGRRGRTGPGGAVVSSLSENAGGTVGAKKNKAGTAPGGGASSSSRGGKGKGGAEEVDIVFGVGSGSRAAKKAAAAAAAAAAAGASGEGADAEAAASAAAAAAKPKPSKWLGKQPSDFLNEWCEKHNRKRPVYVTRWGAAG